MRHGKVVQMPRNFFSTLVFFVILGIGVVVGAALYYRGAPIAGAAVGLAGLVTASIAAMAIRVASAWDRAVVLRLGKFRALRGPGLFGIMPIIDTMGVALMLITPPPAPTCAAVAA